jgi:glycosyltransferase involved in cell wall biosynthesis
MANITVVTLAMKLDDGLRVTLNSVVQQDVKVRHLLIDGSGDSTLKAYAMKRYPGVEVLVQKPQGIYKAMNFGLSKVNTSDYVLFLNASDFLINPKTLSEGLRLTAAVRTWFYWKTVGFSTSDNNLEVYGKEKFNETRFREGNFLIPHPSTLIPVDWIIQAGGFNEKLKIVADMDLAFKIFKKFGPPQFICDSLSAHELGGISTSAPVKSSFELRTSRLVNFPYNTLSAVVKRIGLRNRVPRYELDSSPESSLIAKYHTQECSEFQRFPLCCRANLLTRRLD